MKVYVVIENCCRHFEALFTTEEEALAMVEEYGQGYSFIEYDVQNVGGSRYTNNKERQLMIQEYFCSVCNGYAVVEARMDNSIRVVPCQCQYEEESL